MRHFSLILAAVLLSVIPVTSAFAQGNSAVDEYTETIPGSGGDKPSSGGEPAGSPLPSAVADQFNSAGSDGVAASRIAQTTGPGNGAESNKAEGTDSSQGSSSTGEPAPRETGGAGAVISEILGSDSDSGLGIWLPIILGAGLLAAVAVVVARVRGGRSDSPA